MLPSCKKETINGTNPESTDLKMLPDGFNFSTYKSVEINIRLLSNNNQPLKGVVLSLFKTGSTNSEESIFKAISDDNGYVKGVLNVPSYVDTLIVDPDYVGLLRNVKGVITSNEINAVIGGSNAYIGDIAFDKPPLKSYTKGVYNSIFATNFVFPNGSTSYTDNVVSTTGLPKYLASTTDVIDVNFLSAINSLLKTNVSLTNPNVVGADNVSVLNITKQSDVSITYVSSSAAFYNTLGYYTYNTATGPPSKASDISKMTYIFPNCRYTETKKETGIKAGNKVNLGSFPAGTSIAFVIFQNAWNTSGINTGAAKFYSNSALNPESNTAIKRHTILLHDVARDVYIVGFEDQLRTSTDNDFNDVVVYASASTKDAISDFNVPNLPTPSDIDGDGVLDISDQFPSDPSRAYISYFPSQSNWGTLAFEDNWPSKGDYDLNDLVVSYRYSFTSNANNSIVDLKGDFAIAAAGATFKNGFGVQFPFAANLVSEVTGQHLTAAYISKSANGLEAGQAKAVIIPFDDHTSLIKNTSGSFFINTENDRSKVKGDTVHVQIQFTSPQPSATIGLAPFNPFLISDQRRGYEIHLPGYLPTDKVDSKLFGTVADRSNPLIPSTLYKTDLNWPWALSFTETFIHPIEMQSIDKGYLHFLDWASSTATPKPYSDWYSNTSVGYRDPKFIYNK
ncbi:MAG: hypothetical protein JWQ25_1200 [Daejeonella sp.]|nr:hypothetical protein [Daejeonella sp.]